MFLLIKLQKKKQHYFRNALNDSRCTFPTETIP